MYSCMTITNFRGIESLNAEGFRRINLILGRNNAGKTSLLEALFLLGGSTNPLYPTSLGQLRGQRWGGASPDRVWRPLFRNLNPRTPIEIKACLPGEIRERTLKIEALEVTTFADSQGTAVGWEAGVASTTQDFSIGGLKLRYTDSTGSEVFTHAIFDPRSGNIDAPSKDREDFVRTTMLSARAYSSL